MQDLIALTRDAHQIFASFNLTHLPIYGRYEIDIVSFFIHHHSYHHFAEQKAFILCDC